MAVVGSRSSGTSKLQINLVFPDEVTTEWPFSVERNGPVPPFIVGTKPKQMKSFVIDAALLEGWARTPRGMEIKVVVAKIFMLRSLSSSGGKQKVVFVVKRLVERN